MTGSHDWTAKTIDHQKEDEKMTVFSFVPLKKFVTIVVDLKVVVNVGLSVGWTSLITRQISKVQTRRFDVISTSYDVILRH